MLLWMLLGCVQPRVAVEGVGAIALPSDEGLSGEVVVSGTLSERVSHGPAELILFYGGEEGGSLEPCGCSERPRGGLARQAAYMAAAREAADGAGTLAINGGGWLDDAVGIDGNPRADTAAQNRWMVSGMRALGMDVLHVGYPDMAGLAMLTSPQSSLPLVSANLHGPGVQPHRVVVTGGMRVGVTGISTTGSRAVQTPGFTRSDPYTAGKDVLEDLQRRADITVLIAYQASDAARRLARAGLVDVVIDVQQHQERHPPIWVGSAVWVRSHYQTLRLGELRLNITDGAVVSAVDRKIDLDPDVPEDPGVLAVVRSARQALDVIQQSLYGR